MKEICEHIYQEEISYENRHMSPRNLYLVKGRARSLMIDTAFRTRRELDIIKKFLKDTDTAPDWLDIFITHDHPDHTGLVPDLAALGARIFMNPEETKKRADLMHCYLVDDEARQRNMRIVGVTMERTPEVYQAVMEYTRRAYAEQQEAADFPFLSVHPGDRLEYGEYSFQVISLKGHTFGQCGLLEQKKRLLFCGDQIMAEIVPIVGSQQTDLGLLKSYLESMGRMKHEYGGCRILSCHYGPIADVGQTADRIIYDYIEKCERMKEILEQNGGPMTTREVGIRAYGRSEGPPDYSRFFSCTQIWAKTFSCLEYLYGEGFITRTEEDGMVYWQRKNPLHFRETGAIMDTIT